MTWVDAHNQALVRGDKVRLQSKPDGQLSQHYSLTVGGIYEVMGYRGSNVQTTTDVPGERADYWHGRVEKVSNLST
jgi:hypothetical protein